MKSLQRALPAFSSRERSSYSVWASPPALTLKRTAIGCMADYLYAFQSSTSQPGFLRAPSLETRSQAQFVVAGVPCDGATTNRPGARHGPTEIRRASHMLCEAVHPFFEVSPVSRMADVGDLNLPNTSLERMCATLEPMAAEGSSSAVHSECAEP
jgi:hypothetical protein